MKKHHLIQSFLSLLIVFTAYTFTGASPTDDGQKKDGFKKINPEKVTIVRDEWGVPHIFAETNPEVAYGLAFANAEDDFATMQELFLAGNGLAWRYLGKDGTKRDFISHAVGINELVESQYEEALSDEFKEYLDAYCQGLNAYAAIHPEEILVKKAFPVEPKDLLKGFTFATTVISGVHKEIAAVLSGNYDDNRSTWLGSNAMAFNSTKTADGSTMLVVNPHQPVEGPFSWYEAHLCSEEGMNILGGLFPGGTAIHLGTNENLGWAHTVNGLDIVDVFELEMHPKEKHQYKFDGEWKELEKRRVTLKVKLAGLLPLPIWKTTYWSEYGSTLKSKNGKYYAIRFAANQDIRGTEQMYHMNQATNYTEFREALEMGAYPRYNIVYADRHDTIMYLCNGLIPKRDTTYDWSGVLPGNTSKTLWTEYHPIDDLPQVLDPECGYVFNMNNTPFNATCESENVNPANYPNYMGFDPGDNNRSERFMELIEQHDKVTFEDIIRIKFDNSYPDSSKFLTSLEKLENINPEDHPKIAESLKKMKTWDRTANMEDEEAGLFLFTYQYLFEQLNLGVRVFQEGLNISEDLYVEAVSYAQGHLMDNFNTLDVTLGEIQRAVRGEHEVPIGGFPDALAANYFKPYKNGKMKLFVGDSYVQFVKYNKDGVQQIESLHPYGASSKPDSPHFADQMELYSKQQTKRMTLDKEEIFENAERIYHPK